VLEGEAEHLPADWTPIDGVTVGYGSDEALDREDVAVVWTQQGIRDPEAGARVEDAGKKYVEDRCLKVEYQRLM